MVAEPFRQLRTNLRFVDVDRPPRSIVVTSANAGEGKSTVAANLAEMIARAGTPTILVDADLRRPTIAATFDLDLSVGLTQVLVGDLTIADVLQETSTEDLQVITSGRIPANPSELLGSQRRHALITELTRDHMVIFDAPPLLPVTDAGLLTVASDGALLVVAVGKTAVEQVELCGKVLSQVGGRILGGVLNRAPTRGIGTVLYDYGYGYSSFGQGCGPNDQADGAARQRMLPASARNWLSKRGSKAADSSGASDSSGSGRTSGSSGRRRATAEDPAPENVGGSAAKDDDADDQVSR